MQNNCDKVYVKMCGIFIFNKSRGMSQLTTNFTYAKGDKLLIMNNKVISMIDSYENQ